MSTQVPSHHLVRMNEQMCQANKRRLEGAMLDLLATKYTNKKTCLALGDYQIAARQ